MNSRMRFLLGLAAYNAYRASRGGPAWLDLTPEVRSAWCDAACAARDFRED